MTFFFFFFPCLKAYLQNVHINSKYMIQHFGKQTPNGIRGHCGKTEKKTLNLEPL